MKLKLVFFLSVATALFASSCQKPAPETILEADQKEITVPGEGASIPVKITCNADWKAACSDDWVTLEPKSGSGDATLQVTVASNVGGTGQRAAERESLVRLVASGKSISFRIIQNEEGVVFTVPGEDVEVEGKGGTIVVRIRTNTKYEVSIPVDWITPATKGVAAVSLSYNVAFNAGDSREATLTFTPEGGSVQTLKVKQAKFEFKAPYDGEGTEASPYIIDTPEKLAGMSTEIAPDQAYPALSSAWYSVTADLDMSGKVFNPICQDESKPFKGHFLCGGHAIKNLKINNTAQKASGIFAYTDGATVSGINLVDADINSDYVYAGGIVGYAKNGTTVENCSITGQVRAYTGSLVVNASDIIPVTSNNAGYEGGFVGIAVNSTVKNCALNGKATFYGKFSGGIVGYCYNSTVEKCSVGIDVPVNIYYHYAGGVVGRARGENTLIKDCCFEGLFTQTGYCSGGIVGQLFGGKVEGCVLGSNAYFGSDKYLVGGIVGTAQPFTDITIEKCACYGRIRGQYSVAGIVGYTGGGTGSDKDLLVTSFVNSARKVTIRDCATTGSQITATGGNSNGYPISAGILGWSHSPSALHIVGCYSIGNIIETTYGAQKNGVLSGISAYQNGPSGTIENCYSNITASDMIICNESVATMPETLWYAAIHIRCTQPTTVKNCYSDSSMRWGYSSSAATESGCGQYTVAQMTDGTLLGQLKATANGTSWVAGTDGYPTIEGLPADPHVKVKAAKKISVIGDSISTFRGWIPGGYSAHYPAVDGTLTLVNETYWYRLAHDYMKSAEIDVNIAFSGSTVTNTTDANYADRYGTASNSWWHNSYSERFAACGGCGNPDIILIHGGTNDWSHNADPLAPGVAIRNDANNIYGGNAPSADMMTAIFSTADAARTRAAVNALPDGTFCEAYCKLLCQIRERYPKCKVVCIIGDYLNQAIEQSTIQIADHYGAKVVNLFRVNGFNDLGGYSPSTLQLGKPQPNMPKHDHTDLNSAAGCHPGSQCMAFMAEKIYKELGPWLEQ